MPSSVWREVVKIQRKFLWSGLTTLRKISWVRWDEVCKPKKEGGLGIRNVKLTNDSLLAKWRWKLLQPDDELWKSIVTARYGVEVCGRVNFSDQPLHRSASSWWRNICLLDKGSWWFENGVEKRVENGTTTLFWEDTWRGGQSLATRFPRLYSISLQKMYRINAMGYMDGSGWEWDLLWRRDFFAWEEPMVQDLIEVIHGFSPTANEDRWIWKHDPSNGFTVKSSYVYLDDLGRGINNNQEDMNGGLFRQYVFGKIWKSAAPSKVCAFSWQLLLQRIPTRENLRIRGVNEVANLGCPMCGNNLETESHLFLHCDVASNGLVSDLSMVFPGNCYTP
jgi:hypothetical protein